MPGRDRDRVADPSLEGGRHLLVEHYAARPQRALEESERLDVIEIAGRNGEHRGIRGRCDHRPQVRVIFTLC